MKNIFNYKNWSVNESNDYDHIKEYIIFFKNNDEMVEIAKKLKELGFEVFNYDGIVNGNASHQYNSFRWTPNKMFSRTITRIIVDDQNHIRYDEFIKINNKKYKRIENPELDPFGEEDWGVEEIVQENVKDYKLPDDSFIRITSQEEYWEIMRYLENAGYKWYGFNSTGGLPTDKNFFRGNIDFCIRLKDGKMTHQDYPYFREHYPHGGFFDAKDILGNKRYKKIKKPSIDPFDEEDWGFEEIVQESVKNFEQLKDCCIFFKNNTEKRDIAKKLVELGFPVFNYNRVMSIPITSSSSIESYNSFVWNEGEFTRTQRTYGAKNTAFNKGFNKELKNIQYFEFINIYDKLKKSKKIENPELDPFGEEDWGYE